MNKWDRWAAQLERYGHRCAYCGADGLLARDHVIPQALGGGDEIENLAPACTDCNSRKRDRLDGWLPRLMSESEHERLRHFYADRMAALRERDRVARDARRNTPDMKEAPYRSGER